MGVVAVEDLLRQAELLSAEDQLKLAARLLQNARPSETPKTKWKDVLGLLARPAFGEDAQEWVSRNRAESDGREIQWAKK